MPDCIICHAPVSEREGNTCDQCVAEAKGEMTMERTVNASTEALDCAATILVSFSDRAPSSLRGELSRIARDLSGFDYPLVMPPYISEAWPLHEQLMEIADRVIDEQSYGEQVQIDASNAFAALLERFDAETFNESSDYADWCLKATPVEMVLRAFELVGAKLEETERRDFRLWRYRNGLATKADAIQLLHEELHTEGKIPCKETCDDLQRIAEGN